MKTLPFISFVTFMRLLTNAEPQFLFLFTGDDNICHRVLTFIKRKGIINTLHRLCQSRCQWEGPAFLSLLPASEGLCLCVLSRSVVSGSL